MHEGSIGLFINIPAFAIVFGGMTCATMIHFSMGQVLGIFSVVKKTLLHKAVLPQELIRKMVNYAAINRRDGAWRLSRSYQKSRMVFSLRACKCS